MYVGVLLVVLGEAWLFNSRALLAYAAGFWGVASAFVLFYEEPTLRRKFGGSYARYYRDPSVVKPAFEIWASDNVPWATVAVSQSFRESRTQELNSHRIPSRLRSYLEGGFSTGRSSRS
jgi:hypothetical protein